MCYDTTFHLFILSRDKTVDLHFVKDEMKRWKEGNNAKKDVKSAAEKKKNEEENMHLY